MDTQQLANYIFLQTKEYRCYGLEAQDIGVRVDFAYTLKQGDIVVDFGIGQVRTAIAMAMANPRIYVFVFDIGRDDIKDENLLIRTANRCKEQEIHNLIFQLGDSRTIYPKWKRRIKGLSIDSHGGYNVTKAEITRWFPFVDKGGKIFMQSYNLNDQVHSGIKNAVNEYIELHKDEYKLGDLFHNTQVVDKL